MLEDSSFKSLERVRITVVVGSLNRGGCEMHLYQVLPRLRGHEFDIDVFTLSEPGELAEQLRSKGVNVVAPWIRSNGNPKGIVFRLARLLSVSCQLWCHFLSRRPDITHFYLPSAYYLGAPLALISPVKALVMSRRSLNLYQKKYVFAGKYERCLHRFMAAILGNSQSVVDELISVEGANTEKTHLIYNGIDFERFSGNTKNALSGLSICDGSVVIAVVANIIPYKGHVDLLTACALLPKAPRWCVLLIGRDDGIADELKMLARENGIGDRIHFLGGRTDVPALLRASDFSVLPSHEEGFSNAIIEAMAAGIPVIATDVGGNKEAVVDGTTGFIVAPHAPQELASAMTVLLNDRTKCEKMGAAGRKRVLKKFSLEVCVERYKNLYRSLLY